MYISIMHATAPGFTATRALHACLRCDERYPLALNPKNSNANCLTNPPWKQGKSWKTLTKILLLTRCYSDCLYKTTAGIFATITFATNLHCRYNFLINRYIRLDFHYSLNSFSIPLRNFAPSFRLRSPYFTNACI